MKIELLVTWQVACAIYSCTVLLDLMLLGSVVVLLTEGTWLICQVLKHSIHFSSVVGYKKIYAGHHLCTMPQQRLLQKRHSQMLKLASEY